MTLNLGFPRVPISGYFPSKFAKSRIENENIKLGNLLVCSNTSR
jgi:hypothetical protein